jgi:hypothetical protein
LEAERVAPVCAEVLSLIGQLYVIEADLGSRCGKRRVPQRGTANSYVTNIIVLITLRRPEGKQGRV